MQQNADTSLSCHHNNTNSKTGDSNTEFVSDLEEFESDKQSGPAIETRLARDTNLDITDGQRRPWATLKAAFLCTYPLLSGLREREAGGEEGGKGAVFPVFRERAGSFAGLCVVVDFAMNAAIASSDM